MRQLTPRQQARENALRRQENSVSWRENVERSSDMERAAQSQAQDHANCERSTMYIYRSVGMPTFWFVRSAAEGVPQYDPANGAVKLFATVQPFSG